MAWRRSFPYHGWRGCQGYGDLLNGNREIEEPRSKVRGMFCLTAVLRSDSTELVEVKLRGMRSLLRFKRFLKGLHGQYGWLNVAERF